MAAHDRPLTPGRGATARGARATRTALRSLGFDPACFASGWLR